MENTVIISLEKYDELIELKYQIRDVKKEAKELKKQNDELKKSLLESHVSYTNMRNFDLLKLTDFDSYKCGLFQADELLRLCTKDELVEFIENKYEALHEED